jgi:hypothetical protein
MNTFKRTLQMDLGLGRLADPNPPYVIRLLNERESSLGVRLASLVELAKDTELLGQAVLAASAESQRGSAKSEVKRYRARMEEAANKLNDHLAAYKWHPVLTPYLEGRFYFHLKFSSASKISTEQIENRAVDWLIRHIHQLDRIRRCSRPGCLNWFWAQTRPQKHCGERCRKKKFSTGVAFKRSRAEYMRTYRRKEKERQLNAKKLVRGKSR